MSLTCRQLFEPTVINGLSLGNRLVRSATWEGLADEDGRPTEGLIDLYRQLARGGTGLLVTGFAYVSSDGKPFVKTLGLHDDRGAAAWQALADAVHQEGGKICLQLGHAGGQTKESLCGRRPLAPSAIAAPQYNQQESPQEMSMGDIERLLDAFAAAAGRAKAYGFDAVQLHGAHGYLLNQFLSPHTNRRNDRYGGDLAGRSRFLLETVQRLRGAVGADFPLMIKLNGSDFLPDGLHLEEAVQVAQALDAAGIDAIEVSGGTPASGERTPLRRGISSPEQEAYHLPLAQAIKSAVRCPVMVVGGIRSFWTAKEILRRGAADYISLCRPLIQEPALPQRWRWSEGNTLSRCISCNGCYKAALKGGLRCVLNDAALSERRSA